MLNLDKDVKPVKAADRYKFMFGGEVFECRTSSEIDIREVSHQTERFESDPAEILRWLLGDEGWERLNKIEKVFSSVHLRVLMDGWAEHHKVDLPKSSTVQSSTKVTRMK